MSLANFGYTGCCCLHSRSLPTRPRVLRRYGDPGSHPSDPRQPNSFRSLTFSRIGILILTSNRVGTFDQAFKSRIQLALHYGNLSKSQRYKIWQNFFSRLQDLGEKDMNIADLYAHVGELAEHEMNGRQIRNAITTARQLAQFDGKDLTHELLLHVIKVASKFESYLKSVNQELSEDQLARDCGYR